MIRASEIGRLVREQHKDPAYTQYTDVQLGRLTYAQNPGEFPDFTDDEPDAAAAGAATAPLTPTSQTINDTGKSVVDSLYSAGGAVRDAVKSIPAAVPAYAKSAADAVIKLAPEAIEGVSELAGRSPGLSLANKASKAVFGSTPEEAVFDAVVPTGMRARMPKSTTMLGSMAKAAKQAYKESDIGKDFGTADPEHATAQMLGNATGSAVGYAALAAVSPYAATVAGMGQGAANTLDSMDEADKKYGGAPSSEEERMLGASLGAAIGALDGLPAIRLGNTLRLGAGKSPYLIATIDKAIDAVKAKTGFVGEIVDKISNTYAGSAIIQALEEGGQEAVQELAQNLLARNLYDPAKSMLDNIDSAFIGGGFAGALLDGTLGFAARRSLARAQRKMAKEQAQGASAASTATQPPPLPTAPAPPPLPSALPVAPTTATASVLDPSTQVPVAVPGTDTTVTRNGRTFTVENVPGSKTHQLIKEGGRTVGRVNYSTTTIDSWLDANVGNEIGITADAPAEQAEPGTVATVDTPSVQDQEYDELGNAAYDTEFDATQDIDYTTDYEQFLGQPLESVTVEDVAATEPESAAVSEPATDAVPEATTSELAPSVPVKKARKPRALRKKPSITQMLLDGAPVTEVATAPAVTESVVPKDQVVDSYELRQDSKDNLASRAAKIRTGLLEAAAKKGFDVTDPEVRQKALLGHYMYVASAAPVTDSVSTDAPITEVASAEQTPVPETLATVPVAPSVTPETLAERATLSEKATAEKPDRLSQAAIDKLIFNALKSTASDGRNMHVADIRAMIPGITKPAFDAAISRMYRDQDILVDRHSGPMTLESSIRDGLVFDKRSGDHFVSMRFNDDIWTPETLGPVEATAGTGAATAGTATPNADPTLDPSWRADAIAEMDAAPPEMQVSFADFADAYLESTLRLGKMQYGGGTVTPGKTIDYKAVAGLIRNNVAAGKDLPVNPPTMDLRDIAEIAPEGMTPLSLGAIRTVAKELEARGIGTLSGNEFTFSVGGVNVALRSTDSVFVDPMQAVDADMSLEDAEVIASAVSADPEDGKAIGKAAKAAKKVAAKAAKKVAVAAKKNAAPTKTAIATAERLARNAAKDAAKADAMKRALQPGAQPDLSTVNPVADTGAMPKGKVKPVSVRRKQVERGAIKISDGVARHVSATTDLIGGAFKVVVIPAEVRLREGFGGIGRILHDKIDAAKTNGNISAGLAMQDLRNAGLENTTIRSTADMLALKDVLTGLKTTTGNPVIDTLAGAIRKQLDSIGHTAAALNMMKKNAAGRYTKFKPLPDYVPRTYPFEALQYTSSPQYKDVRANIMHEGWATDAEVDGLIKDCVDYMMNRGQWKNGGPPPASLVAWAAKQKGFGNSQAAIAKSFDAYKAAVRNRDNSGHSPKHSSLDYGRKGWLPIWDPNMFRVLPANIIQSHQRLHMVAALGQHDEYVKAAIQTAAKYGIDTKGMDVILASVLNAKRGTDDELAQFAHALRTATALKLTFAVLPNASQTLNVLARTDPATYLSAMIAGFRPAALDIAVKSGAVSELVVNQAKQGAEDAASPMANLVDGTLTYTGFKAVETYNRKVAATAGTIYAQNMLNILVREAQKSGKSGYDFVKMLESSGRAVPGPALGAYKEMLDTFKFKEKDQIADMVEVGQMTEREVLQAAFEMSKGTQFLADKAGQPTWANTNTGQVVMMFKMFAYHQARFTMNLGLDILTSPAEAYYAARGKGYDDRKMRRAVFGVLALAMLQPAWGYAMSQIKSLMFKHQLSEPKKTAFKEYAAALVAGGSAGLMMDIAQGATRQDSMGEALLVYMMGAPSSLLMDVVDTGAVIVDRLSTINEPEWKVSDSGRDVRGNKSKEAIGAVTRYAEATVPGFKLIMPFFRDYMEANGMDPGGTVRSKTRGLNTFKSGYERKKANTK